MIVKVVSRSEWDAPLHAFSLFEIVAVTGILFLNFSYSSHSFPINILNATLYL